MKILLGMTILLSCLFAREQIWNGVLIKSDYDFDVTGEMNPREKIYVMEGEYSGFRSNFIVTNLTVHTDKGIRTYTTGGWFDFFMGLDGKVYFQDCKWLYSQGENWVERKTFFGLVVTNTTTMDFSFRTKMLKIYGNLSKD